MRHATIHKAKDDSLGLRHKMSRRQPEIRRRGGPRFFGKKSSQREQRKTVRRGRQHFATSYLLGHCWRLSKGNRRPAGSVQSEKLRKEFMDVFFYSEGVTAFSP